MAVQAGANHVQGIYFGLSDSAGLHEVGLRQAVAAARAKAEILADAAGLRLGPVLQLAEEGSLPPAPKMLIMIDALKRASARRITPVLPYFPYAKSDKKDQPRIAITGRLVADLLTTAGAQRVLTDDELSSGGTIVEAARTLERFGAREVVAACTHGVLAADAAERIARSPIRRLVLTNTVPVPAEKRRAGVEVLSVAALFAEAIARIHRGESVTVLFN